MVAQAQMSGRVPGPLDDRQLAPSLFFPSTTALESTSSGYNPRPPPRAFCCFSATLIYGSAVRATGAAVWLTSSSLTQSFTAYIGSAGCVCVCVCAAGTVPVRQPGWYFSAGSAETWPSQHHGGVNQWNPIRHQERWERNWAAKKAPTETKSETFFGVCVCGGRGGFFCEPTVVQIKHLCCSETCKSALCA